MPPHDLKSAQLAAVQRMLSFNEDESTQWKVLIYDASCRSIISPILSVQQLRKQGVTLHLLLHSEREPIPDVPAVYFCRPTKENLARIAQDCAKGLYSRVHLNFVTKLERTLMEDFARLVVQSGSLGKVASVHDQYLDYVCMEQGLFSLAKKDSYVLYNNPNATEASIEAAMTDIAYGLFSVVATLGQIPVIRCPSGGAPEMVARKLNRMIAEHPTLLRNKSSMTRPLLVILDRNSDLITPIQHTSTYQALIDDLLKHTANRVEFTAADNAKKVKKFDLDPDEDPFYKAHKFQPFPEAIESNGTELQQVTDREQEVRSGSNLASAVDSLPVLLERKKQLEVHTSILQAVMNQVAARDVPQFYELESSLATGSYRNDLPKAKRKVMELIGDASKGSVHDKLRLVVVYSLATAAKTADLDEVTAAIQIADPKDQDSLQTGIRAINYLKQLRSMHMIPAAKDMMQELGTTESTSGSSTMFSLMAKATTQATGLLAKATDKVVGLLGKINKHHATVVVENLCEMRGEDEEYLYLDPKVKGDVSLQKLRTMNRAPVREVIAFVIGGGCYGEYQNLQMVASDRLRIGYGSTELLDSEAFLGQLGQLGK